MRKEISVTSAAASENGFEWVSDGKGVVITGYRGRRRHISIPWYIDNVPVVEIQECAFCMLSLLSVKCPDTLEVIGAEAFVSCEELRSVHMGCGVKIINDQAFYGCNALEHINIPTKVETIGNHVFHECFNLKEIEDYNCLQM